MPYIDDHGISNLGTWNFPKIQRDLLKLLITSNDL